MTKGEEGQTIQWQKEKKDRQYNDKRRWTQRQTMVNKIVHKNLKQRTTSIVIGYNISIMDDTRGQLDSCHVISSPNPWDSSCDWHDIITCKRKR
jgi:hypothetical protein